MRWAGRLWIALITFLMSVSALLYGADFFLRHHGDQISEAAMEYLPGADISFSTARLKLGWRGAAVRVSDLKVGEFISSPKADVWVNKEGLAAVLYAPAITLGVDDNSAGLPFAGSWAVDARDANITWRGMSVTLHNARLQLRRDDDLLRTQLDEEHDGVSLHIRANIRGDAESIIGGSIYVESEGFLGLAGVGPPWQDLRATLQGILTSNERFRFFTSATLPDRPWLLRASGGWHASIPAVTMSVLSEGAPLEDFPESDAYGGITVYYEDGGWRGRGYMYGVNPDGKMRADVVWDGESIDADAKFVDVPAASLKHYVPNPDLQQWFEESVGRGEIDYGLMSIRNAPLNSMSVGLTAVFSSVQITVVEDWPPAENLNGIVVLRGDNILLHGDGQIGDVSSDDVLVKIISIYSEKTTLYVETQFNRAPTREYLKTAEQLPPARPAVADVTGQVNIAGTSRLTLSVVVPLATPKESEFFARLNFTGDGVVRVRSDESPSPPLRDVGGDVDIKADGVQATLTGNLQGRAVTVNLNNEHIVMRGRIAATTAMSLANVSDVAAGGESEFMLIRRPETTVFVSDMRGVTIDMPSPFGKDAEVETELSVVMSAGDVRAKLETGDNTIRFNTSKTGADIALNVESLPPPESGVNVHGTAEGLNNADGWFGRTGTTDAAISLRITDSQLMNAWHKELVLESLPGTDEGKQLVLDGDRVAGTVSYRPGMLNVNFSRLMMDDDDDNGDESGEWRMGDLTVGITVAKFDYDDKSLGHVVIQGEPEADGWRIGTLHVMTDVNEFRANGFYDGINTEITAQVEAADAAALLSVFGQTNIISDGVASANGRLFWTAAPSDFSLARLGGRLSLRAENVRYTKTESGVIGLLAVLSPQSLLELGFTEIGKDGVQLDEISGAITFEDGTAFFHDVVMRNDDLSIIMVGEVNMVDHTLNIRGRVRPGNRLIKAGSTAAIGAGLAAVQPLSIAAGWLLGKVFERPLSEIGAYNYAITGDWDEPEYVETGVVLKPPPEQPEQP